MNSQFRLHHTMLRVKDPEKSRNFYEKILGMKFLGKFDFPEGKFSLMFFAFTTDEVPEKCTFEWLMSRKVSCIELTHNWGTENQDDFSYSSGNTDPGKGFGHIAIATPDVYKASEFLESQGVKIRRKPGPMMGGPVIAFAEDPDGYWVELVQDVTLSQQ